MRVIRVIAVAVVTLTWVAAAARAEDPAVPTRPRRPETVVPAKYVPVLPIFDAWGPSAAGKKWVRLKVDCLPGLPVLPVGYWLCRDHVGWLVEDGPACCILVTEHGHRLVVPTARGLPFAPMLEWVVPVARQMTEESFRQFCREFLDQDLPNLDRPRKKGELDFRSMDGGRASIKWHAIAAARYAVWAEQAGEKELAVKLFDRAADAHALFDRRFVTRGDELPLDRFLALAVGSRLRNGAIRGAHGGRTDRSELMEKWQAIAAIPGHEYVAEAKQMVQGYAALILEDREWVEPDRAALAKLPAAKQAEYWVHHLRDHAALQEMFPGRCDVMTRPLGFKQVNGILELEDRTTSALELEKLGSAAVPALIAHLDDPRPTRCLGQWRPWSDDGLYLLRYADCCQQIFVTITGHALPTGGDYPTRSGKEKACKTDAEKWYAAQLNKR